MTDAFLVLQPGPCTSVQDLGRTGHQQMGMPVCGALDTFALRTANLILGNAETCAVLEMTVVGPQLAVMQEADVVLTGADMEMKLNSRPVVPWQSMRVEPGDILSVLTVKSGCRGYLGVTGGIQVPEILGSRSTYIDGKVGGFMGRPLQKGDIVQRGKGGLLRKPRHLPEEWVPTYTGKSMLRAVPGPQDDHFKTALKTFFTSGYRLTAASDRMGCRLEGPVLSPGADNEKSIISEPTMPGNVQVPADGQPIILFAEQTVGGYAKIATVISTDLQKIAQAVPGDRVRFRQVGLAEAHVAYREREEALARVAGILSKQ